MSEPFKPDSGCPDLGVDTETWKANLPICDMPDITEPGSAPGVAIPFPRLLIEENGVCLAVVNGGSALAGYSVSLFANGLDAAPTGTGTLHLPECSAYSSVDLPAGTVLLAHSTMVITTGGSET